MALFHCIVRHGAVNFWGVFHWVLYLVPGTFLVPPRPRFQAICTVTKTWRVNSTYHWLAGENRHYCHWTCDTRPSSTALPARFKSAQPAKDRTQLLFEQTHHFVSTKKCMFCCLLRKYTRSSRWSPRSGSSESFMGWRGIKKSCVYTFCTLYIFRVCFLFIFLPLYLCFASIKNNLIE